MIEQRRREWDRKEGERSERMKEIKTDERILH